MQMVFCLTGSPVQPYIEDGASYTNKVIIKSLAMTWKTGSFPETLNLLLRPS
jgi:hypothetical protein